MTESTFSLPNQKRRTFLAQAAAEYADSVALAQAYLTSRGLTEDTIAEWCLGYVFEPLPGHERFKGYLSIPYITPAGVLDMKFRCLQQHDCGEQGEWHRKYDAETGGGKTRLFGVMNLQLDLRVLYLCEGEMDTIAATQAGLPAVGISGAKKWKHHWLYNLEHFEDVVVLADNDDAGSGRQMAEAVCAKIYNARSVMMPEGHDVNSYMVAHGAEGLRERVGLD